MSASTKSYRIICNDDGGTPFCPFAPYPDSPFSVETFAEKTTEHLVDTHVDVLTWTRGDCI